MGVREDLVASAVTFLQDPSVANAPLDKRIAFLQSKNLTQEEVDVSLARAADAGPAPTSSPPSSYSVPNQPLTRQVPSYGYGPYQGGYWQQPPPHVPSRDWRDYFIMATVMSGLSYGLYFLAKRYVVPLIAPPTPPQLEQDKSDVNESFNRAFSLIEQLSNDTAAIKASEEVRKERLDTALSDFEAGVQELKGASSRRDEDTRRINDDVRALHEMLPKAMKAQEESAEARLKELSSELKSLRTLVTNRVMTGNLGSPKPTPNVNGGSVGGSGSDQVNGHKSETPSSAGGHRFSEGNISPAPDRSNTASPYGRFMSGKGGIPAWQMAASKKNEQDGAAKDTSDSGTAVDANVNNATPAA